MVIGFFFSSSLTTYLHDLSPRAWRATWDKLVQSLKGADAGLFTAALNVPASNPAEALVDTGTNISHTFKL